MFDFNWAKLVQMLAPLRILLEVVGDTFGKENVPGISAIHHSLRNVDPSAGDVGSPVNINDFIDGAAVDAHPDTQFGLRFQPHAHFQCASRGRLRIVPKNQSHAIASWQTNELMFRLGNPELFGFDYSRS